MIAALLPLALAGPSFVPSPPLDGRAQAFVERLNSPPDVAVRVSGVGPTLSD